MREEMLRTPASAKGGFVSQAEGPSSASYGTTGPLGPFLDELLNLQCRCCRAKYGAILQMDGDKGSYHVVASYPSTQAAQEQRQWLERSAAMSGQAFSAGAGIVSSVDGDVRTHAVIVPLRITGYERLLTTLLVRTADKAASEGARQLLELTVALVGLTRQHLSWGRTDSTTGRLRESLAVLSAINQHQRFRAAAMAFCNEIASQWHCERAGLGLLRGRYVRLEALSHTEHFGRKMKLVQDIEAAMEECLDQDSEIVLPASPDATYISRTTAELAGQHGPTSILSLPLRHEGSGLGVLLLQRPAEQPFQTEEIETLRLTCDLSTPHLANLRQHDRWVGARAAAKTRRGLAVLLGPEHTWAKLLSISLFALIVFLAFAQGTYKAEASFVLEATEQHTLCAPFDGFLKDVQVEVGDVVEAGQTVLAELDTAERRLQLAAARAEQAGYLKEMAAAMRDGETAQAQIAQANADRAQAQIELNGYYLQRAKILTPASGTVVTGDLKRQIGAPVKIGDALFEVAPLESLRAELRVPEDQIFDIAVDQHGYLATVSYPSRRIEFVIERIDPAAELVENRNVFTVRARLLEIQPWMRPGMEGVAKVTVGKRHYLWIWTRKLVNWVRMKLWI